MYTLCGDLQCDHLSFLHGRGRKDKATKITRWWQWPREDTGERAGLLCAGPSLGMSPLLMSRLVLPLIPEKQGIQVFMMASN